MSSVTSVTPVIGALVGLAGATNNNGRTEDSDGMMLEALAFMGDEASEKEMVEKIHTAKFKISPSCMCCGTPCGNTSDYDPSKHINVGEDTRAAQAALINALKELSGKISEGHISDRTAALDIIYRGISFLGYDLAPESYDRLVDEINRLK